MRHDEALAIAKLVIEHKTTSYVQAAEQLARYVSTFIEATPPPRAILVENAPALDDAPRCDVCSALGLGVDPVARRCFDHAACAERARIAVRMGMPRLCTEVKLCQRANIVEACAVEAETVATRHHDDERPDLRAGALLVAARIRRMLP